MITERDPTPEEQANLLVVQKRGVWVALLFALTYLALGLAGITRSHSDRWFAYFNLAVAVGWLFGAWKASRLFSKKPFDASGSFDSSG